MNKKSIPIGYLVKNIKKNNFSNCKNINEIYSVSGCISKNIIYDKKNKNFLFSPLLNNEDAFLFISNYEKAKAINLDNPGSKILALRILPLIFTEKGLKQYDLNKLIGYKLKIPKKKFRFIGFDIVNKEKRTFCPGCSPFTCNDYADKYCELANEYGLINTLEHAIQMGKIIAKDQPEEGDYLIFEVLVEI